MATLKDALLGTTDLKTKWAGLTLERFDIPRIPRIPTPAESAFGDLKRLIEDFEANLDDEHLAAFWFASCGQVLHHVNRIVLGGNSLIVFEGVNDDGPFRAIQHVAQLNFTLQAVKRKPDEQKQPIGFYAPRGAPAANPHSAT